ncbi:MAG: DUF4198 domain-containing protein [bacterium]|nr:DUF4198 domain-containing protein [bacterium]
MSWARVLLCGVLLAGTAGAHDLFLKFDSWFLSPDSEAEVDLFNGTFGRSDNVITRDRMLDVSIVRADGQREHPDESQWRDVGQRTRLGFRTGGSGTYLLGVSTKARMIEMTGEEFDGYLEHDGVLDVLEARRGAGTLGTAARERYSKHVKAIAQVGPVTTGAALEALGYPIEIVPLSNPYELQVGDFLPIRVEERGQPLAGQLVYASHGAHHVHDESGNHVEAFRGRTDESGQVAIPLEAAGPWYVRLIRMVPCPEEQDVDYESNWATLTFEMRPAESAPGPWLWIAVPVVLLVLAIGLVFRRRAG